MASPGEGLRVDVPEEALPPVLNGGLSLRRAEPISDGPLVDYDRRKALAGLGRNAIREKASYLPFPGAEGRQPTDLINVRA